MGDVTPAALAAQAAAELAASEADTSANAAAASVTAANASAVAADASADAAALSAVEAATSADAAALSADVYPDTATGLAAVAEGGYFSVPSSESSEYLILYRDVAGVATEVKRYPSAAGVDALAATVGVSDIRQVTIGETGTIPVHTAGTGSAATALRPGIMRDGVLKTVRFRAQYAGTIKLQVWDRSGDTFTLNREVPFTVVTGQNEFAVNEPVLAGQWLGATGAPLTKRTGPAVFGYYSAASGTTTFTTAAAYSTDYLSAGFDIEFTDMFQDVRPTRADLPFETGLIVGMGQSLMQGSQTTATYTPPITTAQEYDNLTFRPYSTTPANEVIPAVALVAVAGGNTIGEWPGLGAAAAFRAAVQRDNNIAHTDVKSTVAVVNSGWGGQTIDSLLNGASGIFRQNYAVQAATNLAKLTQDARTGVLAVLWGQGESDADISTAPATYKSKMVQFAELMDTNLRAATGQTKRIPWVSYQMCQYATAGGRAISLAQAQAAREHELIYLAFPTYILTFVDMNHPTAASQRIMGAYFGEAVKAITVDGTDWQSLQPTTASIAGNTITLTFNKRGLAFDTTLVPAQTNQGFSVVTSGGAAITVNTVEILNGNQVRITCATTPTSGCVVKYGAGAASGKAPYVGGAGNLRDSAGTGGRVFDGWPLHNWCELFDWTL